MKKISNSVRIGMVPREPISTKLHEEHSPPDSQEHSYDHRAKEQVFSY